MALPDTADLHPAVASVLGSRRLGEGQGAHGTFTIARTRALLALRAILSPSPWHWTLALVRAANVLSESPQGVVEHVEEGESAITRLVFSLPGASFEGLDLRELLGSALEADRAPEVGAKETHERRLRRFRALVARAINRALAGEYSKVELLTPVGGRAYARGESSGPEHDPYSARPIADQSPPESFAIRLTEPRPGVGRRLGKWISGRGNVAELLTERWRSAIVGADAENDAGHGMSLAPLMAGERVELGEHARWWGSERADATWLVRDGVKLCKLDNALALAGLPVRRLFGWIDCPALRLTADEGAVAKDGAFELLVAWLHDMLAHGHEDAGETADGKVTVAWPTALSAIPTASGYTISLQALGGRVRQHRDLVFVWCHQAQAVPASARARVLSIWPSELALLEHVLPDARFVPLRALGTNPDYERVDLTSLGQGSLEPLPLAFDARFDVDVSTSLVLDVVAYIHRFPAATMGAIVLLAHEREVAHVRDPRRVIPGLTLLCRIRPVDQDLDLDTLRDSASIVDSVAKYCRELADRHLEAMLGHVNQHANAWENPLVRAAIDQLSAVRLGLRYIVEGGRLRLTWDPSVLLDLPVASTRSGARRTLGDFLRRCRDVGHVVEAWERERWATLESREHEAWIIDEHARPLLARVAGAGVVLRMPVVPDAYPVVAPAASQRGLLRKREELAPDITRSSTDPLARLRLLGHLLVAREQGVDLHGLDHVALLSRYDPRAAAPTRLVALQAVLDEDPPPGLAFPAAVSRELAGPVLEVPPGVASLLHEAVGLEPETAPRPDGSLVEGVSPGPLRKRSREPPPLVTHAVVHPIAAGSLRIAGDGDSRGIALWSNGLRVGEIHLPEPLGRVSGRLWLTRGASHETLREVTTTMACELFEELVRQRSLLPPSGPRRAKLDALVEYARQKVQEHDAFGLGPLLGVEREPPRTEAALDRSLRAWPLRRLSPGLERWLAEIVIQSIGFRVNLDTAFLSWSAAKVRTVRADGSLDVELGRRNAWVRRALEVGESGDRIAPFEAAALVIAEFFAQARARGFFAPTAADEAVAYWRLLALLFENGPER